MPLRELGLAGALSSTPASSPAAPGPAGGPSAAAEDARERPLTGLAGETVISTPAAVGTIAVGRAEGEGAAGPEAAAAEAAAAWAVAAAGGGPSRNDANEAEWVGVYESERPEAVVGG